jgi:hypothetical protein
MTDTLEVLKRHYGVHDVIIDDNGLINGSTILLKQSGNYVETLLVRFGHVANFHCEHNHLTTLVGAPNVVDYNFFCNDNRLKNLIGGPTRVGMDYTAENNPLTSLEGIPTSVGETFRITWNESLPIATVCDTQMSQSSYIFFA